MPQFDPESTGSKALSMRIVPLHPISWVLADRTCPRQPSPSGKTDMTRGKRVLRYTFEDSMVEGSPFIIEMEIEGSRIDVKLNGRDPCLDVRPSVFTDVLSSTGVIKNRLARLFKEPELDERNLE